MSVVSVTVETPENVKEFPPWATTIELAVSASDALATAVQLSE